jgi:hypothetical protein
MTAPVLIKKSDLANAAKVARVELEYTKLLRGMEHYEVQAAHVGYVYFIEAPFEGGVATKIGKAKTPGARVVDMQTGNPTALSPVFWFRCDMRCEKIFHRKFKAQRIRGEWFDISDDAETFAEDHMDFIGCTNRFPFDEEPILTCAEVAFILATLGKEWNDETMLILNGTGA